MNLPFLISAYLSLFFLGLMDMARGPLYPDLLAQFEITPSTGSFFFTIASFSALLANLCSSWWMKKWGNFGSLRIFTLLQALGGFGMGAAGYLPQNGFLWMLIFAFIFGLSLGGLGILINVLVVDASPLHLQQRLLSGVHTMYGLAAIVAPLLVTQVLILFADWRICFFIMSFGVLLLFIYLSLFVETKSKTETIEKKKTEKKPLSWAGWLAATSMSFYVGAEMIISTRIVLFLTREYDFSLSKASYYLTLFFVGLMAGRLLVAVRNWSISSWVLMALSLITSFAFFLMGFYLHPLGFAACGLSMSIFFPTMIAVISKNLNNESDRVIAVGMTGVAVVLIAMHWAFGLISDKWNMTTAMALGPVFLAIAFFSLFSFRKGVSHA